MTKICRQPKFEHRAGTKIINLKDINHELSEHELLLLGLPETVKKKPLDFGSFAYFLRGKNDYNQRGSSRPVVLESLVESRRELIARLLESLIGLRPKSVLTYYVHADYFVDWLNMNGYRELFYCEADAQRAFRDFTAHLNNKIHHLQMKPVTASGYQNVAAKIVQILYPESSHNIIAGAVNIISEKGSLAASLEDVELYRDVFLAIASQCSEFVVTNKSYPCVVNIRDYEVVLFPSTHGSIGPFKAPPLSYNSKERRIATVEEYLASREQQRDKPPLKYNVSMSLKRTNASLMAANINFRHWHRYQLAGLAMKSYVALFIMITGATPSEFEQFTYADAIDLEKSPLKKELSSIKFRAAGKKTFYNLGRDEGVPLLKEYFKLRDWILNGELMDKLFFAMPEVRYPKQGAKVFTELRVTESLKKLHDSLSGVFIDSALPKLSARKMRKHKSVGMHTSGISPSAVASSLNHSQTVNFTTYAEATPEQQEAEFSAFWQSIRSAAALVKERSEKNKNKLISIPAGHCSGFNTPTPLSDSEQYALKPNCQSQYGCLYCQHYVCHSDEEDVHKLLSLRYVIDALRNSAPDAKHAETLYQQLSIQIDYIIDLLGDRSISSKKMINRMKEKVFNYGELTSFWETRLSRYEKMGVVF